MAQTRTFVYAGTQKAATLLFGCPAKLCSFCILREAAALPGTGEVRGKSEVHISCQQQLTNAAFLSVHQLQLAVLTAFSWSCPGPGSGRGACRDDNNF